MSADNGDQRTVLVSDSNTVHRPLTPELPKCGRHSVPLTTESVEAVTKRDYQKCRTCFDIDEPRERSTANCQSLGNAEPEVIVPGDAEELDLVRSPCRSCFDGGNPIPDTVVIFDTGRSDCYHDPDNLPDDWEVGV